MKTNLFGKENDNYKVRKSTASISDSSHTGIAQSPHLNNCHDFEDAVSAACSFP